ncbi:MAG: thioredoxin domain-containing protein [Acidobacteria bacterium]|nr:thioredoxin domain-containing protein [Acidobacteriota bacterium]
MITLPAHREFCRDAQWVIVLSCWLALAASAQSPAAAPAADAVAVVGGTPISAEELNSQIRPQLQQLRNQEYEVKSQALENLINQKLVEAEAQARELTVQELLQQEVDSKIPAPTDPEVEAFYQGQKDRINRPLEEVKDQIRQMLKQNRQQQLRQSYLQSLRERTEISVHLAAPRIEVSPDPNRMRGSADAPVKIVEFSDFQCPYCQKAYPTVQAVLAKYGAKVNLSYRDFPLRSIHPQAQMAAHASRCAGEQGKFWEYHNSLFEMPNQLGKEELTLHAATVGMETEQFKSCLESGRYDEAIEQDVQAGMQAGVSGTPAFFINGILVSGSQPAAVFERTIDTELAASGQAGTPAN